MIGTVARVGWKMSFSMILDDIYGRVNDKKRYKDIKVGKKIL